MKGLFLFVLLLLATLSFSQRQPLNFYYIDRKIRSVEICSPDSLAKKLTSNYTSDVEKTRSIFRWITENIAYKTHTYLKARRTGVHHVVDEVEDSIAFSKGLNERVAYEVLKNKEAVCDGYCRLFKVLCDYAGVHCEIVTGYARTNMDRVGAYFKSNHRWNAVYLDSSWYLLDVTWASGYMNFDGSQFIKAFDENYFLTPPKEFIRDHYPEDARWTLLADPPTLAEFQRTPFKNSAFNKYSIVSFAPERGVIEAEVGDTISVEVLLNEIENRQIAPDTLKDDIDILPPAYAVDYLQPAAVNKKKVNYQYPITSDAVGWLNIVYNEDVILRYKLNIRKNKED